MVNTRATPGGRATGAAREYGSAGSTSTTTSSTALAWATVRVRVVTQSSERQAGSTPRVEISPRVGLTPTSPLNAAGTRPEPAVSVPRASGTTPAATATALPLLDPPLTCAGCPTAVGLPNGLRVPTSPVANWSMFVLATGTAPAATRSATTCAWAVAGSVRTGQAAVVGSPATSMLSFTANGNPASGPCPCSAVAAVDRNTGRPIVRAAARAATASALVAVTGAVPRSGPSCSTAPARR